MNQGTARAPVVDHVTAREVVSRVKGTKRSGNGWVAQCPAHEDQKPSLSITEGADGRVLLKCFAGCSFDDVCRALRIDSRNLGPDGALRSAPKKSGPRIVATYDYLDENRKLLFQVVRYDPKGFSQRRPDGKSGWVNNLVGVRRVLYRLPELLAADPRAKVFVVEGEKDANKLMGLGLLATTSAAGVGKWRKEYSETLRGRQVVIVPDNDKPGLKHAEKVAVSLHGLATSVRLLFLPNLADKGDVSEWLDAGGTVEQLRALAIEALAWNPQDQQCEKLTLGEVRATDLGNARRLVFLHGQDVHYCYDFKKWLVWDTRRWQVDSTGAVFRFAKDTVTSIYSEAAEACDEKTRTDLGKWAIKSEAAERIVAMLSLAQSEPDIPIEPKYLDADPMLLNCANGTVDLRTGKLREHWRQDLITKLAPVIYDPYARSDLWDRFLSEATGGDEALVIFLQRAAGYSLTGDTSEEVLFFIHGPQVAGKSTFVEAVKTVLGGYATTADFEAFLSRREVGGPRNDIARLAGSRFVASIEVDEGKKLAEGLVKMLTGGDTVTARKLYQEAFEFRPTFKLWLAANHTPRVREDDEAMWRRILTVPFIHTVPKAKRDPSMKVRLKDTATAGPAILAWMIQGCLDWQRDGLHVPEAVEQATAEYRESMDPLNDFISECCVLTPTAWISTAELRSEYELFVKERGEMHPLCGNAFTDRLAAPARGLTKRRSRGIRGWQGIQLVADKA